MEPIRVLQVVACMNMGGIENFLMNHYRSIDRTRVQFDFLKHRSDKSLFDDEIIRMGGRIYNVPAILPFRHNKYLKALDLFFAQHQEYMIVHTHIGANGMYVLRAAKKHSVPIRIAHSHSAPIRTASLGMRAPFVLYTKSRITTFATHCFACGHEAGEWLFRGKKDYSVIPNGINVKNFTYSTEVRQIERLALGIQPNEVVIGHVGSFSKAKNHAFVINIFREILKSKQKTRLLLVGDGKLKSEITHLVKENNLEDKVVFTGIRLDVNRLLQAMDVLVFPSLHEGLPVTLMEAQASGLPCIVSDNVTKEAAVTDLVEFVSLSEPPEKWAKIALKFTNGYERCNMQTDIINAGYDVQTTANWLTDFYFAKLKPGLQL